MTGFVVTPATAQAILDGIAAAMTSRGMPVYWTTGAFPIHSGPHAGSMFIPASDEVLSTPLRRGLTPRDFPQFDQLVAMLGGLDARVNVDPVAILDPNQLP